jgi:hypothetical protein
MTWSGKLPLVDASIILRRGRSTPPFPRDEFSHLRGSLPDDIMDVTMNPSCQPVPPRAPPAPTARTGSYMVSALIGPGVKVVSPLYPAAKSRPGKFDPRQCCFVGRCLSGRNGHGRKVPSSPNRSALNQRWKEDVCPKRIPKFSESVLPHHPLSSNQKPGRWASPVSARIDPSPSGRSTRGRRSHLELTGDQ